MQAIPDVLLFILVAGGLIFAHELGHFVVALWRGVRIEEFGLGFPPRLVQLFTFRGTRITLNLIPFGGFVRPAGEDNPDVPGGLASSSKLTRALVLLAGPATNLVIGFLAFSAAFRFAAPDIERVLVTSVNPGSPAAQAGLQPGDLILTVDGAPVTGIPVLQEAIAARLGSRVLLAVERAGENLTLELTPRRAPPAGEGPIGVMLGNPVRQVPLLEAFGLGARTAAYQLVETARLPSRLLQGQVEPEQARLTGLKGMYDMLSWASEVDQATLRPFFTLQLVGLISVGLGLANLLPIPALDGGRLLFVAFEAVARRRIPPRLEGMAHAVGFTLLMALMLYITFQDFANPIPLPR